MIFCGILEEENIVMHPNDNLEESHYITLTKEMHEAKFIVSCCCNEDWIWEFHYTSKTDYDRIKWCIMDMMCECEDTYELMDLLDEIFLDTFNDMIVWEEEDHECCGNCKNNFLS